MDSIRRFPLRDDQAALWFLGQAGYVIRSGGVTVAVDPYLSDAAAADMSECRRLVPVPIAPEDLCVDLYVVTHDHLDHLDPDTIRPYRHKASTAFVAPRLAARKLEELGVPPQRICVVDAGQQETVDRVAVEGVFALPTSADVLDTTGYQLTFANGRSVYHASDTAFVPLLLEAAPKGVDVLLVPINGKWGNLTVEQAVELTAVVGPRFVLPNHYDMMAVNAENPEVFRYFVSRRGLSARCVILPVLEPFSWE